VILSKLVAELTRDEGVRLKPYNDSQGKLTIGIGRNLSDVGISREEADNMLLGDIERTCLDLDRAIPWWTKLSEVRQRVLANMAFNLGVPGLLAFRRTLEMVQEGKYEDASREMLVSAWASQVGPRAQRLSNMMRDGVE